MDRTTPTHFNQKQLARRWGLSPRTLERWRHQKSGLPYLKIGGRVVYRLEDVLHYEAQRMHVASAAPLPRR